MIDYNNPNDMWRNNGYDPYKGMSDEERMKAGCLHMVGMVGAIIVALLICALFGSCTTTKYVPVIEHRTDTLIQTNLQHDSIYVHDSIMVSQQGDTVRIEKWHTKYVEREVHDTTYISKTDSIPTPYPVEKRVEVEKPLTWWQELRLHISNIALVVLGVLTAGWILKEKKVL